MAQVGATISLDVLNIAKDKFSRGVLWCHLVPQPTVVLTSLFLKREILTLFLISSHSSLGY